MHALDTEEAIRHHIARLAGVDRTSIVDLVVAEGDLGAARLTVTSTDPTRLLATWNETHVFRVENGAIAEHWPHTPEKRVEALLGGYEPPFSPTPLSMKSRVIARAVGVISRLTQPPQFDEATKTESSRALIETYVETFKNQQKFQVFPRLFSHDFRHHFGFEGQPDTAVSFINVGVNLLYGFPDVHVELTHLIADCDYVVEHNIVTATHRGTWAGVAPTERAVTWNEAHIYRMEHGRIAENWPSVNFDELLLQLTR